MRVTGHFGDKDGTEWKYAAYVHWVKEDNEFNIDMVTVNGERQLDLELNMYSELNNEWIEVNQHNDVFYDRGMEDKLFTVINTDWSKIDWLSAKEEG